MPDPSQQTHYHVLGILNSATPGDIRKAYKRRALETHPDKLGPSATELDIQQTQAQFLLVCEAFEVLNHPTRRKAYDYQLAFKISQSNSCMTFSEGQEKLRRDREEWARQLKAQQEQRMNTMRQSQRLFKDQALKQAEEAAQYSAMIQEIVEELRTSSRDWMEREHLAGQRQARTGRSAPRYPSTI